MNERTRKRVTALLVISTAAAMVAMSFAAVPLYREFCQLTGFAGTPRIFAGASNSEIDRAITVGFNADTGPGLSWTFAPAQGPMTIKLGETALAQFKARNNSDHAIVGKATFNITPFKAALYFDKIACFCFTEQRLEPGEELLMPVTFYVDPALATDPATRDVNNVTLSYTFYQADDSPRVSASRDGSEAVN
jgi:cytochrome c oxidase assembly protein subunit 11